MLDIQNLKNGNTKILEYKLAEKGYISKITYELKARLIQQELLMEAEAQ